MKKLGITLTLVPEPLETELKSLLPYFSMSKIFLDWTMMRIYCKSWSPTL